MSSGLLIGSLVVLAIGSSMVVFGHYGSKTSKENYDDLDCGKNIIFKSGRECDNQIAMMGASIGVLFVGGFFIIVGFIASIVFGVKLVIHRYKKWRR